MHEGKGLSLGGTKMEVEVQRLVKGSSLDGDDERPLVKNGGGKVQTGGLVRGGSGGSAGDESSSDEPALHESTKSHHTLPPKKYRLKEPKNNSGFHLPSPHSRRTRSPLALGGSGRSIKEDDEEMLNIDDSNHEDDESSGPSIKESRISHSFTSGEVIRVSYYGNMGLVRLVFIQLCFQASLQGRNICNSHFFIP
jgi:hypothetical protein